MEETTDLLTEKLFRLEMLLHRYAHVHAHGRMENPHRGQGRVLMLLYKCRKLPQRELPYLLGMRQQSVSELLLKLEKKGLIQRTAPEEDKRSVVVSLTEEGLAAGAQAEEKSRAGETGELFTCLQEDERRAFERYLDRIIENLESQMPDIPHAPFAPPHHHGPGCGRPHEGFERPQVRNLADFEAGHGHRGPGMAYGHGATEECRNRGPHRRGCPHGKDHHGSHHGGDGHDA